MKKVLPPEERKALKEALTLLEINRKRFALSVFFGSGAIGSGVGLGAVSAWLIARAAQLPPVLDLSVAATSVRAFGVGKAVFRYLERISSHWVALKGMSAIRSRLYERLANAPMNIVAPIRRGDLLARTGSDVDALGDVVIKSLLPAAVAIVTSILSIAIVAGISLPIGIILGICLFLSGLLGPYFAMRGARISEIEQVEQRAELNVHALTILEHADELRISNRLGKVESALANTERNIQNSRNKAAIPTALATAIDILALGVAVVSALVIGTLQVTAGTLSEIGLVVCTLTPLAAFESTQRLHEAGVQLIRSARAAVRIMNLINVEGAKNADVITSAAKNPTSTPASLTTQNLAIAWPDGPLVAESIDLTLTPGKSLAIVGQSGIGKSTLLYTLAGMISPHTGQVQLNEINPGNLERAELAQYLSLTSEDAHIFETSVLENLRVANGALTPEQAIYVLNKAGLTEWLSQLPEGLDTIIGTDANSVSGGERRRLLLARALASPAQFLLLDEPAEHLDTETADRLIHDLLTIPQQDFQLPGTSRTQRRGVIIVTHRLGALATADEVLVLSGNPATITARGSHQELLAENANYRWSVAQED